MPAMPLANSQTAPGIGRRSGQAADVEAWLSCNGCKREVLTSKRKQRHVGSVEGGDDTVQQERIRARDVRVSRESQARMAYD